MDALPLAMCATAAFWWQLSCVRARVLSRHISPHHAPCLPAYRYQRAMWCSPPMTRSSARSTSTRHATLGRWVLVCGVPWCDVFVRSRTSVSIPRSGATVGSGGQPTLSYLCRWRWYRCRCRCACVQSLKEALIENDIEPLDTESGARVCAANVVMDCSCVVRELSA